MNPGIGLFAKPPLPGRVKTRLTPPLTPEEAAGLYASFLSDLALMLDSEPSWDWVVYSTRPGEQEATWEAGVPRPKAWREQRGADLGARMESALGELLAEGRPAAALLGSDHPTISAEQIRSAMDALREADVVFGPTLDGGYYLVGLSRPAPGLFDGVPWSTPEVLEATLDRVDRLGLRPAFLPPWYDVDTPADLAFLRGHLEALVRVRPEACPRTRERLQGLSRGASEARP